MSSRPILRILIAGLMAAGAVAVAQPAWESIDWNSPMSWPDRLLADEYVLPDGWQEATEGVDEISFYNSGGLEFDIATAMNIARFEELTGIRVNAIPVSADLAEPKSLTTLVSRDTSVDAVLVNDPAYNLSSLVSGGWVTPVDHMWPEEVTELYNPNLNNSYMMDGHWWILPVTYIGHVDFYRPSMLEGAGLDVPDTYEEFRDAIPALNEWIREEYGAGHYASVYVGGTQDTLNWYRTLMYAQGKKLFEDGAYQFDTPESRNAFALMVDMIRDDQAPRDILNYAWGDAGQFFGVGNAGWLMAIQPSYITVFASGDFPDVEGDVEVIAPPKWSADTPEEYRGRGVAGSNSMLINSYIDDNQKAAVMLFGDYIRSLEGQRNELIVEGNESALLHLWETLDEQFDRVDWELADRIASELQIPSVPRRTELPAREARELNSKNAVFEVYLPGFSQIAQKFLEEMSRAALGEQTVDEALEAIQALADELS